MSQIRDHFLGIGPTAAEQLVQETARFRGDRATVDDDVELSASALLNLDLGADFRFDLRSETRRARFVASSCAVQDGDFHAHRVVCAAAEFQAGIRNRSARVHDPREPGVRRGIPGEEVGTCPRSFEICRRLYECCVQRACAT